MNNNGESSRSRGRRLARPLLVFCALATVIAGCSLPKEPGSLWWDVDVVIPLAVRTYGIWDLADPDSVLRVEGSGVGLTEDSSAFFSVWTDVTARIGDSLYLAPYSFGITKPVTALKLPVNFDGQREFSLGQLNGEIASLHGTVQDLPPHNLQGSTTVPVNELVQTAVIDTGFAPAVIINDLPYPVYEVNIRVVSDIPESETIFFVDSLEAGSQIPALFDLSDANIGSDAMISITASSSGASGIQVDSTDAITIAMQVDTVTCSQYVGIVPEQLLSGDTTAEFSQQHLIDVATIASGTLAVNLINETQFEDTLTLVLPNLINQLTDSLVVTRVVPPGESRLTEVNLEGFRIRLPAGDPQLIEGRIFTHSAQTNDVRTFPQGLESVSGEISMSRLRLQFFSGTLRNLVVPVDSTGLPIERPPDGWEAAHPTSAEAIVHILESLGGVADVALDVTTLLQSQPVADTMLSLDNIDLATDTAVTITELGKLIFEYPDSVSVVGDITLNGVVSLLDNSTLELAVELVAPFTVVLDELNPPGDIEKVVTADLEDVKSGTAELKVRNRLPVSGRVFIVAARDSIDLLETSTAIVDTIADLAVPLPVIQEGRAISEALTETTIELSDSVIHWFQNPPFYTRTDVYIPGSGGDTLTVHGTDFLSVQILARLLYEVRTGDIE